jgi:hypothetical protein
MISCGQIVADASALPTSLGLANVDIDQTTKIVVTAASVPIPKFATACGTTPMRTSESKGH